MGFRIAGRRHWAGAAAFAAVFVLVFSAAALAAAPKRVQHPIALPHGPSPFGRYHKPVCASVRGGARCFALVVTTEATQTAPAVVAAAPGGYGPVDLQRAYSLSSLSATGGTGQTVAIVDAYDDPTAESDLATYRSTYGLSACTSANGCFRKVDQHGGSFYPPPDGSWSEEISLDLDMVSAIAPNSRILLVEGNSASYSDLATAANEAAALGATQISNSYGGDEAAGVAYAWSYSHPGIAVTASTGDSGYGCGSSWAPCFPASVPAVEAVGGTSLSSISPRTESAWVGASSGCSAQFAKPSWQHDTDCPMRSVGDESAVADPATGVAVYTSVLGGWAIFGGTSASAPIIASFDALIGSSASSPQWAYQHTSAFDDVTTGSNNRSGSPCNDYLCNASPGYDGPTGLGTPNGAGVTPPPAASTGSASNVGISTAAIAGTVNPNGYATGYRFDYGTTTAYGTSTAVGDAGLGTTDVPVSAQLSGLSTNTTYHYRVVAVRGDSAAATGSDHTFTTQAPPSPPGSTGGATNLGSPRSTGGGTNVGSAIGTIAGTVSGNLAPPRLSGLVVSPKAFSALNSGRSIVTKGKNGPRVTFTLSEKATITFTVERAQAGRLVGGRCQTQTQKNRKARACTFYVAVKGSFKWAGSQGGNKFRFTGRINGKQLARGTYRLVAVARDASGNLTAPVRVTFTIK